MHPVKRQRYDRRQTAGCQERDALTTEAAMPTTKRTAAADTQQPVYGFGSATLGEVSVSVPTPPGCYAIHHRGRFLPRALLLRSSRFASLHSRWRCAMLAPARQ